VAYGTRSSDLAVIGLGGEPPLAIKAPGNQTLGLDWGADDRLYYAGLDGIYRIPSRGGDAEHVTRVDTAAGEFLHAFPRLLPGGRGLLYTAVSGVGVDPNAATVAVLDLESGETHRLIPGIGAGYSPSGHILAETQDGTLLAAPFDLGTLRTTDDPVAVLQGVARTVSGVDVALSEEGTLIYLGSGGESSLMTNRARRVVLVNRAGEETPLDAEWQGDVSSIAVSPSGDRVAASVVTPEGESLWVTDPEGPPAKRTFQGVANQRPEWTPDGRGIVFYSDRQGGFDLWEIRADGSSPARLVLDEDRDVVAAEFSPDGTWLVFRTNALQAPGADILARRRNADGSLEDETIPLVATAAGERSPTFSPDGRWLAYVSDESGRDEIYVRPFPDMETARWQVSVEGATEPLWSRGGGEIFYRRVNTGELVSVALRTEPTFATGQRRVLFSAAGYATDYHHRMYDVFPGDTTFVFIPQNVTGGNHLVVVDNFFADLEARVGG
jgi:serine/threonine-protein kinase